MEARYCTITDEHWTNQHLYRKWVEIPTDLKQRSLYYFNNFLFKKVFRFWRSRQVQENKSIRFLVNKKIDKKCNRNPIPSKFYWTTCQTCHMTNWWTANEERGIARVFVHYAARFMNVSGRRSTGYFLKNIRKYHIKKIVQKIFCHRTWKSFYKLAPRLCKVTRKCPALFEFYLVALLCNNFILYCLQKKKFFSC